MFFNQDAEFPIDDLQPHCQGIFAVGEDSSIIEVDQPVSLLVDKAIPQNKLIDWLSKKCGRQGVVIFRGRRHTSVCRDPEKRLQHRQPEIFATPSAQNSFHLFIRDIKIGVNVLYVIIIFQNVNHFHQ